MCIKEPVVVTLYKCKTCKQQRERKCFSLHKQCKEGIDVSRCKPCKKSKQDWSLVSYEKRMFNRVKARSLKRGINFSITIEDIVLPDNCPVFKVPFIYGHNDWTYSLDRVDPTKGYVKGNIQVISNRANMLKNNASSYELRKVADFIDSVI